MMNAAPFTQNSLTMIPEPLTEATGPLRVVVLHGWGNSRSNIRGLALQLAALGEVWIADLPGHGDAPVPTVAPTPADLARLVNAWLATLPPCPTLVIGHSMGFRVATHMVSQNPDAFVGLVAVAGAGVPRPLPLKKQMRKRGIKLALWSAKVLKPFLGEGILNALRQKFGSRDYLAAGQAMRPMFLAVVNDDTSLLCPTIQVPVLLIYGSDDTETPPELGQKLAGLFPKATLQVLPHHTHASVLEGGRHLVARAILAFALPMAK